MRRETDKMVLGCGHPRRELASPGSGRAAAVSFAAAGILQFAALSYSVALRRVVAGADSVFIAKAVDVPIRIAMSQYIMIVFLAISFAAFAVLMVRAGDSKVAKSNGLGSISGRK